MGAYGKFGDLGKSLDQNIIKTSAVEPIDPAGGTPIPGLEKAMETMPSARDKFIARDIDLYERGILRPVSPGYKPGN
jgi:hypothetical protein